MSRVRRRVYSVQKYHCIMWRRILSLLDLLPWKWLMFSDRELNTILSNAGGVTGWCRRRRCRAVTSARPDRSTHSVWTKRYCPRHKFPGLMASSSYDLSTTVLFLGESWLPKCTRTNLAHLGSWKSSPWYKQEANGEWFFVQLCLTIGMTEGMQLDARYSSNKT